MKSINPKYSFRKKALNTSQLIENILAGDKLALSKAITLIEQGWEVHYPWIKEVLDRSIDKIADSRRIGITGPPGVGKSTFIDSYGFSLLQQGHNIAVLAVDPSSTISKGSILGDKTRMANLGFSESCFIRPSPSSLHLGGIRPSTLLSLQLCAAAGFNYIFVESVGVGQSETDIYDVVDLMIMLLLPGSGDDIQSIKKGIIEVSDLFVIHKADGDQKQLAKERFNTMKNVLKQSKIPAKPVVQYSSLTEEGKINLDLVIQQYLKEASASGQLALRRQIQNKGWTKKEIYLQMERFIKQHPIFAEKLQSIDNTSFESDILPLKQTLDVYQALEDLFL